MDVKYSRERDYAYEGKRNRRQPEKAIISTMESLRYKPRALIVEDDEDYAFMLRTLLENRLNMDIVVTPDCASARHAFSSSNFDIITLDQQLPDGTGSALLEEIIKIKEHPSVIMVTGNGSEETAAGITLKGAAGYIVKDNEISSLLPAAIERALKLKQAEKSLKESEVRYRRLFEAARDGILILEGGTGEILDANPYLLELLGYELDEIIGKILWELGPFNDNKIAVSAFSKLSREGYIRYEHLPLQSKHGYEVDVEFVSNVYIEEDREVIQCNIRNVSERKLLEKRLSNSEKKYRGLFDSMKEGVLFTDMERRILGANQAFLDEVGYSLDELRELTFTELTPPKWQEAEDEIIKRQVLGRGYSDLYEKEYIRKDGSVFPIAMQVWLINGEHGVPTGMWGLARDITEQKQARDVLEKINTELNEFAHLVAHDLRTPISSLKLAGLTLDEMMSRRSAMKSDHEVMEIVGVIDRNVDKLDNITENLLSLAQTGQVPEEITEVDLTDIVKTILAESSGSISDKKIKVEVGEDLGKITANPTQMNQIFSNLISNSIKHNDNPCPIIQILRLGDGREGLHRFLVRDNGTGIEPRIIDIVFQPFIKGKTGGSGIGLAIVKKLVEVYDGEIKAYNNKGACFEFSLKDIQ